MNKSFNYVKHEWIIKFLGHRIADRNFIRLIKWLLKSGIIEEGKYYAIEEGILHGGVVSPILSNIYLHYVLDLWVEKVVEKKSRGYVEEIKYADDFVICVKYKEEAEGIISMLRERLKKFGLELSEEKTRLILFSRYAKEKRKRPETFDFLGFTLLWYLKKREV